VGQRFSSTPVGLTTVSNNTMIAEALFDPNWQFGVGALWFDGSQGWGPGPINVSNALIEQSPFECGVATVSLPSLALGRDDDPARGGTPVRSGKTGRRTGDAPVVRAACAEVAAGRRGHEVRPRSVALGGRVARQSRLRHAGPAVTGVNEPDRSALQGEVGRSAIVTARRTELDRCPNRRLERALLDQRVGHVIGPGPQPWLPSNHKRRRRRTASSGRESRRGSWCC